MPHIGRLVDLGVDRETSRGAGMASAEMWIPKIDFSFDDKIVKARSEAGLGVIADSDEAFVTTKYGAGDMSMELRSQVVGFLLYSMFGTLSTAGPTDSAYTHSFSVDEGNQHDSLALFVRDTGLSSPTVEQYKLAMVNTLEFVAALDETVKVNVNFMSKKGNVHGALTPSYTAESKFTKKHVQIKVAANIAGLGAASVLSVKNARLTLNQNAAIDDAHGTAEPEDILNHQLSVEGELVLNYDDETWKDYFRTPTDRAMEVKFVNTDDTIGAGSTNPSLTIQMPKVDFFDWEPNYALDEIVSQTVSFKANYDLANSLNIVSTCDLVNAKVSY